MKDANKATHAPFAEAISASDAGTFEPSIPDYMLKTYEWAYINPVWVKLLDRNWVVTLILWGNRRKLMNATLSEVEPGQKVFQAAHVYGDFTRELARAVGERGRLDVVDVVPIQVEHCKRKLAGMTQAKVRLADASFPGGGFYDVVSCYFLLHEVPDDYKRAIVDTLLSEVRPGGKAVFVDYHKSSPGHLLKGFMNFIFRTLEPYAFGILENEISSFARHSDAFSWRKETYFGGLYQKVVAVRREAPTGE